MRPSPLHRARRGLARAAARLAARANLEAAGAAIAKAGGGDRRTAAPEDRLAAALAVVAEAEQVEPALPTAAGPVTFWGRDRVVRRPEVPASVASLIPSPQRGGWAADAEGVREISAAVAADLVVMAKFDVNARTKLRAGYGEARLTLAVQPPSPTGVDGIARALRAHEVVGAHAPSLIAPLRGHGRLSGGLPYLVEDWLDGAALGSDVRLAEAAPEILRGLATVHRGHGVTGVRVGEHWAPLAGRWEETIATGVVDDDLGRWVAALVARDGLLRRSWVHGDLVASNVMRTPTGIVLIDWEHSQEGPIMNDAAKLHLFAADPDRTLEVILDALGDDPTTGAGQVSGAGPDHYTPAEELALAHAQLVSLYPRRSAKLVGHPRAGIYEKQVRRQVERLAQVRSAT